MPVNGHKPKLLFLAPGSWVHGQKALKAALAAGLDTVFVDSHDPKLQDAPSYKFIKLPRSGYSYYRKVLPVATADRIKDSFWAWWFKKLRKQVAPDIVHVCWIDHRAAFCSRVGMRPLVLSCWGSDVNFQVEEGCDSSWRAFVTEALSGAALTIVDAPGMAERCEMLTGRSIASELLHLGVDTDHFRSGMVAERRMMRARLNLHDDDVLLSSMRAMSGVYNHDSILDAFAQAMPKLRRSAYLLFKTYNSHPGYLEALRQNVRDHGLVDRVKFVGASAHEELPALYAATDIVVNFPQRDSFPVTLLEAGGCERPVISGRMETYVGVLPDENITWVPAFATEELAEAMVQETNQYEYRGAAFPKVRNAVIESFSELRYQRRLAAIYQNLAS